ncbi:MAG: hydroxyacylglutathione hydrolase [Paracoccaceae bacterium]
MPLEIITIPCRTDNYAFLAHDPDQDVTALIDIPEAGPILAELERRNWSLDLIFITHHHDDHVDGLADVLAVHPAHVLGRAEDAHRLPKLDTAFHDGDSVKIGSQTGRVIDVSGHTIHHVAFHFPDSKAVFTADSLMALGCGRVFEGTKPQMWASLQKLAALPPETRVYSGHEYTASNAKFALSVDPDNPDLQARVADITAKRAANQPTVPSALSLELATNPFLRADKPSLAAALGLQGADPEQVFAEIRSRKDVF